MKKIVILTSSELRHKYFKIKFAQQDGIHILKTFCDINKNNYDITNVDYKNIKNIHFSSRSQVEKDFFEEYVKIYQDFSRSENIKRGEINDDKYIEEIYNLNPDFIVTYGCCIIKPKLINLFKNRIINVHLGLSPFYFGSGTNFHPFVNNDLSAVGCTFIYMDEGIDTGKIIHQMRAHIDPCDSIHQVGCRLIKEMTQKFIDLIKNFDQVTNKDPQIYKNGKIYKRIHCTEESVRVAYKNINSSICLHYLINKNKLDLNFPLVEQDFLC
mgnify:CR=1 FL=1